MLVRHDGGVLVVDDESAIRKLVRVYLERHGLKVFDASSGEEAVEVLAREGETVSLLLTDVVMPGMSGRDLARLVRESKPDVPIILMSGYCDQVADGRDGIRCLQKPLDFKKLVAEVSGLLQPRPNAVPSQASFV